MIGPSSSTSAHPEAGDRPWIPFPLQLAAWFGGATLVGLALIRPFATSLVGFDAATYVIHFDRLVAGRRIEGFVTETPKPLLTLIDGLTHALTPDWRALTILSILALAAAVVLAVVLATRLAGWPAGAFAGIVLLNSPTLIGDVADSGSDVWALIAWLVAGLALSRPRPRWGIAAAALLLGGLARLETLLLVALAIVVLIGLRSFGPAAGRPPRRAFLLAAGGLCLPIQMVHDWLLTGNPLFFTTIEFIFSAHNPSAVQTPLHIAATFVTRYLPEMGLVLLALIGVVLLIRRRQWPVLLGLVALAPGIAAFLLTLAARHIYVSSRYYIPIDLSIQFAAAIGISAVRLEGLPPLPRALGPTTTRYLSTVAVFVSVAVVAIGLTGSFAPRNSTLKNQIAYWRSLNASIDQALPVLRSNLAGVGAIPLSATTPGQTGPMRVTGPILARPRLIVDLGLPTWEVGSGPPPPGTQDFLIFHDRATDTPASSYAMYEISVPTQVGTTHLTPLLSDPAAGLWVVLVRR